MPEFSAGAIWIEVDGKRLDEYGERVKAETPEAEAKSCLVEVPNARSRCKIMFNYQREPLNSGGARPDAMRFDCAEVTAEARPSKDTVHDITAPVTCFSSASTTCEAFEIDLFDACTTGVRHLVDDLELLTTFTARHCIIKVVISPKLLQDGGGERDYSFCMPAPADDPWQKEGVAVDNSQWWGILAGTGRMHMGYISPEVTSRKCPDYPQISVMFQLSFKGMSCAKSMINPDGAELASLPKTVSRYDGKRPPLPPPVEKPPITASSSSIGACDATTLQASYQERQDESKRCQRYRAEIERLAERLADAERRLRGEEAEQDKSKDLKRQSGEETMTTTTKRLHVEATPDGELKIQYDMCSDFKREKKEETARVSIKKEDGEVRVKQEPSDD